MKHQTTVYICLSMSDMLIEQITEIDLQFFIQIKPMNFGATMLSVMSADLRNIWTFSSQPLIYIYEYSYRHLHKPYVHDLKHYVQANHKQNITQNHKNKHGKSMMIECMVTDIPLKYLVNHWFDWFRTLIPSIHSIFFFFFFILPRLRKLHHSLNGDKADQSASYFSRRIGVGIQRGLRERKKWKNHIYRLHCSRFLSSVIIKAMAFVHVSFLCTFTGSRLLFTLHVYGVFVCLQLPRLRRRRGIKFFIFICFYINFPQNREKLDRKKQIYRKMTPMVPEVLLFRLFDI